MQKPLLLSAWAIGLVVLLNPQARAVDPDMVNRAIDAGVAHLKQSQNADGTIGNDLGATALAGLALLECGVGADEACIKKAAEAVRQGAVANTGTYQISLSILFLDKLRDPADIALIESLTVPPARWSVQGRRLELFVSVDFG